MENSDNEARVKRGVNLQVDIVKQELLKVVNSSGLPVTLIKYIFQEFMTEIERNEIEAVNQERAEYEKEIKELENKNKLIKKGGKENA